MDKQISIAIAGGGIAGVALASYLSKISHLDVCLYESAPQFSEIGAGISFGANAVHAIEQLGLADDYHAIADKVAAPHQDVWFQWRDGYTADYLSSSVAEGVGQSSVHRADFLDAIIKHIPAKNVQFSKKLQQITEVDDQVQLTFSDGTVATCDYLIGADGIHSVTRQYVLNSQGLDDVNPRFSGTWAYRGIIRYQDYRDALIALDQDVELADVPQMLLGQDKHILTFPIRNGELINIVAFKSDRNDLVLPEGTAWTKPVSAEQMLEDFADWHLGCRTLLELIEQPTIWALHEIEELSHYQSASSRVILMGDAAHAMLPHQGAGAGQGLEDAVILANLLEAAALEHDHLNLVSTIYEQSRLQRACRVQRTSRESGEIYELCHPDYRSMQAVGEHLAHRFDWLWTYDLQAEIAQVKQQLAKQIESVDELA